MKVTHIIGSLNDGGAEAVLYRLCERNGKIKYNVISLFEEGKYGPMLKKTGVSVECLHLSPRRMNAGSVIRLYKIIKKVNPDVVQTWMYHANLIGGIIAKMAGVKRVFWSIHHTTLEYGDAKRLTIYTAKILAVLSKYLPAKIIMCAQKSIEVHAAMGYDKSKMVFIPNGYDLSKFRPVDENKNKLREALDIRSETLVLGMVGRYNSFKDHDNLLGALEILNKQQMKFICILVGKNIDENNPRLIKNIKDKGLFSHIKLLGVRSDIPALMNLFDLYILSSRSEAFPNVLAEAMSCGTPCVTTDVGDSAYIVGDTGWVVPPQNSSSLADAIINAINELSNTDNWEQRRLSARHRIADNFSIEKMNSSYYSLWIS